jgi:type IV secretion system protein VirB5
MIDRIASAQDPKAVQDLQARIQAEQNMLTNEQTKLQSLYQMVRAGEAAQQLRLREQASTDVGSVRSLSKVGY